MPAGRIFLSNGIQANEDIGSFAVIHVDARADHPLTVRLGVVTDEEHRYTLSPGDSFPVRDQTWRLEPVENAGSRDWIVTLTRVA
ncbi:hypothetical protein NE236_39340 [Actinoallomurus purpureus]|uniref:DUF6406 domain-containing protein n=1 Tax=Actinoallomurus purpureus TaxID=478114 RepID=UPI0035589937|nr:hypothetical protein [Actinoallomurus purpureus]